MQVCSYGADMLEAWYRHSTHWPPCRRSGSCRPSLLKCRGLPFTHRIAYEQDNQKGLDLSCGEEDITSIKVWSTKRRVLKQNLWKGEQYLQNAAFHHGIIPGFSYRTSKKWGAIREASSFSHRDSSWTWYAYEDGMSILKRKGRS